jgi:hypothetical protein
MSFRGPTVSIAKTAGNTDVSPAAGHGLGLFLVDPRNCTMRETGRLARVNCDDPASLRQESYQRLEREPLEPPCANVRHSPVIRTDLRGEVGDEPAVRELFQFVAELSLERRDRILVSHRQKLRAAQWSPASDDCSRKRGSSPVTSEEAGRCLEREPRQYCRLFGNTDGGPAEGTTPPRSAYAVPNELPHGTIVGTGGTSFFLRYGTPSVIHFGAGAPFR